MCGLVATARRLAAVLLRRLPLVLLAQHPIFRGALAAAATGLALFFGIFLGMPKTREPATHEGKIRLQTTTLRPATHQNTKATRIGRKRGLFVQSVRRRDCVTRRGCGVLRPTPVCEGTEGQSAPPQAPEASPGRRPCPRLRSTLLDSPGFRSQCWLLETSGVSSGSLCGLALGPHAKWELYPDAHITSRRSRSGRAKAVNKTTQKAERRSVR